MLSRRHFCCSSALAAGLLAVDRAFAADQCSVMTSERQSATSPDDALAKLKAGNERFATQNMRNCDLIEQVRATAGGQFPSAVVIGCIDARVPPELVFDQRIGDIFSARVAGNVINDDIAGSAEFATKLAGAKLIVVLGHSECGAIKGAVDDVEFGLLTGVLARIKPAVAEASKDFPDDRTSKNKAFVQAVATANAHLGAERLTALSSVLRDLVSAQQLKIVSAMHDVATGRVTFLD
ncbi:carbonic anhydrase family protein [Hyphomicrobium sp. B1]|jgi:carbonic anhydrase|uniref:carbonic anhydrase family protein n=1 Tax=unclassified Hyphomicrobium TaxID=2619925 RepID=UPI000213DF3D|nr:MULTISPECIES: carbonic anhydrase family protein [unclassified Hyphomicrobium]CCB64546.1 Carbonic anhydrase [Hyphomicrobium sp. MC1]